MREDFTNVLTRGQHDDPFAVLGPHCVTNESGPTVILALKADPQAFAFEPETPRTASVVADLTYQWQDSAWMTSRAQRHALSAPVAIYELPLGSWKRVPEEGNRFLTQK